MNHLIRIKNMTFVGSPHTIAVGDTVSWINDEDPAMGMPHTATRTQAPVIETGNLNSGQQSAAFPFTMPSPPAGWDYACRPHPFMTGTLIVVAPAPAAMLGTAPDPFEARAVEFWYDFDAQTKYAGPASPIRQAYMNLGAQGPFSCYAQFIDSRQSPLDVAAFRQKFGAYAQGKAGPLRVLARFQLAHFAKHFGANGDDLRRAFELFGQGVLLDEVRDPATGNYRRPALDRLHAMDFSGNHPGAQGIPTAYHAWHAFARAAVFAGEPEADWLPINRLIGLAWGIQIEAKPKMDQRNDQTVPETRLKALRTFWLGKSFDELDTAFDRPFDQPPAP